MKRKLKHKLCVMILASLLAPNFLSPNQEIVNAETISYQDRDARNQRMQESERRRAVQRAQREKSIEKKVEKEVERKPEKEVEKEVVENDNNIEKLPPQKTEKESVRPTMPASNEAPKAPQKPMTYFSDKNLRTPSPMTFQEAERYSKLYPKEIKYHTFKTKDKFGNKNQNRVFDFLNSKGLYHSGSTITGAGDTSAIRFSVSYGFENITSAPHASVGWLIGSTGNWGNFWPRDINFVFDEGDTVTVPIKDVNHDAQVNYGIFVNAILRRFHGVVVLTPQDLYMLSNHRKLQSAYISDGNGGLVHLFYSGDKDSQEKTDMMRGFHHACKMLDISYDTVSYLTRVQQEKLEDQRKAAMIESVRNEIERDKLKEQLRAEMEANSNH